MSPSAKNLRDLRRLLRGAEDAIEDTVDHIGSADRDQARRLRGIIRNLQDEISVIDRRIQEAEANGGAK